MAEDFPRKVDDITNEWLSTVLGGTVTGYAAEYLEGGVLSDAFKLYAITYDGKSDVAPSSVVVKLASRVKDIRSFAVMGNAYTKELNFYQHLAKDVPINSPKVHGCFSDGSAGSEFFIIVMEDLTTHSKVFDQVDDPPNEAFARKIALEAAKLHATFWESDTTRLPWVGRDDNRYVFALDAMSKMGNTTWAPFRALWAQMYGSDLFDRETFKPVEELTELLCGPQGVALHEKIYDVLSSRPKTLLHGDMKGDNIFRTHPAVCTSVEHAALTFIDWQLLHAGPPGPELTQAWQWTLELEDRRNDKDMLKQYRDKLVELNPAAAAYTYDMLLEDYTLSYCFWWTACISVGVGTLPSFAKPEAARMKQLWGKSLFRGLSAMRDLDCLALIKRLAADLPDASSVAASAVGKPWAE